MHSKLHSGNKDTRQLVSLTKTIFQISNNTIEVISRSLSVWIAGLAFPPKWITLPHGKCMYSWSPPPSKSGQPSTTRFISHRWQPSPGRAATSSALMLVWILRNDCHWIRGKRLIACCTGSYHETSYSPQLLCGSFCIGTLLDGSSRAAGYWLQLLRGSFPRSSPSCPEFVLTVHSASAFSTAYKD